jgi:hypothetical protein
VKDDPYNDWFVIEGVISHFQWAEGHENLLEQIQQRSRLKNAAAGAAAAALGMYGTLATSSMVATYDGEYTENFACVVDGKAVCGTFCGARKLKNGDVVKLVVSRLNANLLSAHAVQITIEGLILLPSQVFLGNNAAFKEEVRSVLKASLFTWILFFIIALADLLISDQPLPTKTAILLLVLAAILTPLFVFVVTFLPGRPAKVFGEIGSKLFTLLEYPNPDDLNLDDFRKIEVNDGPLRFDSLYDYRSALKARK